MIGIDRKPFAIEFTADTDVSDVAMIYYIRFLSKRGLETEVVIALGKAIVRAGELLSRHGPCEIKLIDKVMV